MNAFELDKPFVTQALKQGDFDYMEVVGTVEETAFFRLLLSEGVLDQLAADYPSPRQKEEVPLWLYLASELTLRLHGAMGFGAYPYVLHCGGLVHALDPRQVEHKQDPESGECRTAFRGHNDKNHYARVTPCDPDFLRKMGKDTRPSALQDWFGTSVVRQYQALDAFDSEGIFLIDGKTVSRSKKQLGVHSLFPLKKGMDLWEDAKVLAHHDRKPWERYDLPPPEPAAPPADRPEPVARREAARQSTLRQRQTEAKPKPPARTLEWIEYKAIEPSQVWESCSAPVGVLLIRNHYANGDELDWALACTKEFPKPLDMWKSYNLRPAVEEDHRQEKCFWDLTHFRSTAFSLVVNRIVFVELAYSLIQIFLRKVGRDDLVGKTRQRLLDALLPTQRRIALYYQHRFGIFESYEYQELLLTLSEGARRKALGKTCLRAHTHRQARRLRRAQLHPPELPWRAE